MLCSTLLLRKPGRPISLEQHPHRIGIRGVCGLCRVDVAQPFEQRLFHCIQDVCLGNNVFCTDCTAQQWQSDTLAVAACD